MPTMRGNYGAVDVFFFKKIIKLVTPLHGVGPFRVLHIDITFYRENTFCIKFLAPLH